MKTYKYSIPNTDDWAITDTEIVVVADNKNVAVKMLEEDFKIKVDREKLTLLKKGVHIIQHEITE